MEGTDSSHMTESSVRFAPHDPTEFLRFCSVLSCDFSFAFSFFLELFFINLEKSC